MAGDADTVGLKIVRGALAGVFFLLYDLREYSTWMWRPLSEVALA
jgi:hypothetical protein